MTVETKNQLFRLAAVFLVKNFIGKLCKKGEKIKKNEKIFGNEKKYVYL